MLYLRKDDAGKRRAETCFIASSKHRYLQVHKTQKVLPRQWHILFRITAGNAAVVAFKCLSKHQLLLLPFYERDMSSWSRYTLFA